MRQSFLVHYLRNSLPFSSAIKAVQRVFANYNLTDDFAASPQYEDLYTELTGTIVLIIEQNNLPTVEGVNAVE